MKDKVKELGKAIEKQQLIKKEAVDVFNKTGMTPSELLEKYYDLQTMYESVFKDKIFAQHENENLIGQRDELYKVLVEFIQYYESDFFKLTANDGRTKAEWILKANNAINSTS